MTATKRKPIGKKVRFEIFKRDRFTCVYCGGTPPGVVLEVDHIVPVKDGGTNISDNLTTSCRACNIGKGATSLQSVPQTLKERAADVAEREAQLSAYSKVMAAARSRVETDAWTVLSPFLDVFKPEDRKIKRDWFMSVKRFLEDLPLHEAQDSMDRALAKGRNESQTFKYFCGTCWGKIKQDGRQATWRR